MATPLTTTAATNPRGRLPQLYKKHGLSPEEALACDRTIHELETSLKSEFQDVLVEDLDPGVPNDRSKQFEINLVPGAALGARRPELALSAEERDEIVRQLQELLR